MSKRPVTPEPAGRTGWARPTTDDAGTGWSGERVAFLKAQHLGKKVGVKGKIVILSKPEPRVISSQFGEQIVLPVKVAGTRYDWGVTIDSGNHKRLDRRFKGKSPSGTIAVELMKGLSGNLFIAVSD